MDAFFARNRLSAYLDGALGDAEMAELSEAIERDPALRAEYEAMLGAVELLRREGPTQAPTGFHARVMQKVADEPGATGTVVRLRQWWSRVPVEALALAAAAAVVVLVIQGRPDGESSATATADDLATYRSPRDRVAPEADPSAEGEDLAPASAGAGPTAGADAGTPAPPLDAQQANKAPARSTSKKAQPSAGPDEPHYAEWEKTEKGGDLATSFGYRLTVQSPEILYNLSSIAEQSGGKVRDSSGRALSPHMLAAEDDFAQVLLVVPQDRADAVHGHLQAMGAQRVAPPPSTPLFSGSYGVFLVEVSYLP